ncbi:MAG: hypothetical protein ACJAUP_001091 [Cellvibrionaceae bacterium]|jgi:hypothetical protein
MKNPTKNYHKDPEDDGIAERECGHFQHVRHDPPWTSRPWAESNTGRDSKLGLELNCRKCDQGALRHTIRKGHAGWI